MSNTTSESPASAGPPALVVPLGLGLAELSEEEFKLLVSQGGTLTLGQVNEFLGVVTVDTANLAQLGITTRTERRAVHIASAAARILCLKLSAHFTTLAAGHENKLALMRQVPPGHRPQESSTSPSSYPPRPADTAGLFASQHDKTNH